jgi:hypothetical protein
MRLVSVAVLAAVPVLAGASPNGAPRGDRSLPHRPSGTTQRPEAIRLTSDVPTLVTGTCRRLARRTQLRVVCPPLVPKTRIVPISGLYGSFSATDVVQPPPAGPTEYYEMSFNNGGPFGTIHWIVAKGTPAAVRFWVLDGEHNEVRGRARRLGVLWVGNRRAEIYRFPEYPAGGAFGSHLAALVRSGTFVLVASIHGYDDPRASARMAVAMARDRKDRAPLR